LKFPFRSRRTRGQPERRCPSYVVTEAERHRWDLAEQTARHVAEDTGGDEATVWLATRSLYKSDIPTE